jgi:yersiniabactin nonribosomal peptide synthetase
VVLTQSRFENNIEWPDSVKVISVDKLTGTKIKPEPPAVVHSPGDIAYVIYTSGSTGVPKGVVIDHRGAVNTILDINQRFHVNSDDRVLALSALSFDLSVYDIFGMLAAGGSIVIPEADKEKDPGHWWELLETRQITLWDSVPALMQMLVEYTSCIPEHIPQSLRLVLLSGDWIPLNLPGKIGELFKNAEVTSLGGATEASIWSILYPIKEIDPGWKSIPYGKPMWNQRFYVLDRQMRICPHWVPGQLFIGGIGAAKGYLNDQEKTNNSFIFHPGFGERLYKTGDLGRYLPDGNIEFLGREDFQVKIRGHRIELGEIEANINAHPGVQEVVVNVYGESRADKRLFAYIVPKPGDESLFEMEAVDPSQLENRWERLNQAGQQQAKNIPGSLSPGSFPVFWDYTENLSTAIICQVLLDLDVFVKKQEPISLRELMTEFSIEPQFENLMRQWLDVLVTKKIIKGDEDHYFTNPGPESLLEHSLSEDLLDEMNSSKNWKDLAVDLLSFFREASPIYTSLLKGDMNPLELFLKEDSLFTAERMSRFNPIAPYTRQVALGLIGGMKDSFSKEKTLRILEIGTRTGSMTPELLSQLPGEQVTYVYTDESSFFLDKARADYENFPGVEYKILDMNNDPRDQGFAAHDFDVIIAENTLHRAKHVEKTLSYINSLLAAGGMLLMVETTRNSLLQLVTVGFFEDGFSHFEDHRKETSLPLLSAEQWNVSLRASGFEDVRIFPDSDLPTYVFNQAVMIARAENTVKHFIPGKLRTFLEEKIPAYMIPSGFIRLDSFPLTANGKIDRKALPVPDGEVKTQETGSYEAPGTPVEKIVADTWTGILKQDGFSIHDDFLALGGDSLQATQVVNILRDTFGINIPLRIMFEQTSISKLANFIETAVQTKEEENEFEEGII